MVGLIFTVSLLSILTAVGFLFAWVVRLASEPDNHAPKSNTAAFSNDLAQEKVYIKKP